MRTIRSNTIYNTFGGLSANIFVTNVMICSREVNDSLVIAFCQVNIISMCKLSATLPTFGGSFTFSKK